MNNQQRRSFFEKLVSSTKAYSKQDVSNMGDIELQLVAQIVASVKEDQHKSGALLHNVIVAAVFITLFVSFLSVI